MNIQHKTAIVTGGGTGIGKAVSIELAKRGARVVVNYSRSREDAEETVRTIQEGGGTAVAVQANVAKETEVRAMGGRAAREFGSVDILINNASITRYIAMNDLESVNDEAWDELYQVNVKGMFYCARAAAVEMKKQKQGVIVNLGSIAGITGSGSSLPYAVSKAAVHGLTRSLARALAPEIRVSSVAPGAVATRRYRPYDLCRGRTGFADRAGHYGGCRADDVKRKAYRRVDRRCNTGERHNISTSYTQQINSVSTAYLHHIHRLSTAYLLREGLQTR